MCWKAVIICMLVRVTHFTVELFSRNKETSVNSGINVLLQFLLLNTKRNKKMGSALWGVEVLIAG